MGDLEVDVGAADRGGGEDLGETAADVEGPDAAALTPRSPGGGCARERCGNGRRRTPTDVVGHVAGVVAVDPRVDPTGCSPQRLWPSGATRDHLAAALPPASAQSAACRKERQPGPEEREKSLAQAQAVAAETVQDVGDRVAARLRLPGRNAAAARRGCGGRDPPAGCLRDGAREWCRPAGRCARSSGVIGSSWLRFWATLNRISARKQAPPWTRGSS